MGKGGGSRKCKRSCGGAQRKNECQSKKIRKIGYSREKRL